jgi:putative glutamine amidotransferase
VTTPRPTPRPVLGLICCTRLVGVEPAQSVMNRYVLAAARYADASTLLVPTLAGAAEAADIAPRLDGLLLTGSPSNVETRRYGMTDPDASGPFDPDRDEMAMALVEAMLMAGKPVFGVCRGLQELNVAFGGTLRRDMGSAPELIGHHAPDGATLDEMFAHTHDVALTPGGVLAQGLGRERLNVNSVHYQGVDRLGTGLTVEAKAPDGVVEAFSARVGGAQVLAVQWHPEWAPEADPSAAGFFQILGRALRGEPLSAAPAAPDPSVPVR